MVDEVTETEEVIEEVTDPIEEARAEDLATEEEAVPEVAPEVKPEVVADTGQPTVETLTTENENLKREMFAVKTQLNNLFPVIKQLREGRTGGDVKAEEKLTPEQIEARLKEFVADPDAFMDAHSKKSFGELSKAEIDPLRGEVYATRTDSAIQQFMVKHPELGPKGEERIGAILDANPHLTQGTKGAPAALITQRLEDALGRLIAQDPAGYAASLEAAKSGGDQSIKDAKNAASGLGIKKGSQLTTGSERDEFDAVLDLNQATRDRYAAGVGK